MQTPKQRKSLIRAGLYDQLEPPENLGQPWSLSYVSIEVTAPPAVKAFRHTVSEVFGREPGEEG